MTHAGFTDVDRSANAGELVDYLARLAKRLARMRSEDSRCSGFVPAAGSW